MTQTTVVVTKVVPTTDAGLVTIWRTSTSTPTLTATTILTVITNQYGAVQTVEVPEYYDSATTISGTPVIISNAVVTTTVHTVPTSTLLASTETVVVVDTSSSTDAVSVVTGTVLPLIPTSSTTLSSSTVTAVAVVTASPSAVNGSPFSSQGAATGAFSMSGLLMLGVGLVVGFVGLSSSV